jgi:hypothetical protein
MVYKVLPQQFSKEWLSNVLALANFTKTPTQASADPKTMSWRYEERGALVRSLNLAPLYGYVNYHNYQVTGFNTNAPIGVPDRDEVDRLAMRYLQELGGETNELYFQHRAGTERKQRRFDKKTGKYSQEFVTMRGVMYSRQLDGIRFVGAGGRGGFAIDFGEGAKIASLELDWRRFQPYRRYSTLSRDDIVKEIMNGKAVISAENGEIPENPSKLNISKITPLYMSQTSGNPEDFIFPFANIEIVAVTTGTNATTFYIDCPLISGGP